MARGQTEGGWGGWSATGVEREKMDGIWIEREREGEQWRPGEGAECRKQTPHPHSHSLTLSHQHSLTLSH